MEHAFVYLVHLFSLTWVVPCLTVVSTLPCHFLVSHGEMGFFSS